MKSKLLAEKGLRPPLPGSGSADEMFRLEEVTKAFGYQRALNKVSFTVSSGQFLTICGPNGAGKTTLLRLLSTLSRPTSGRILLYGHPLQESSARARAELGVISHQTFLYDFLTAQENLRFFATLFGLRMTRTEIVERLAPVGLASRANSLVRTFSQGMKQRLALARATIHKPRILLLDEPFTGLDLEGISLLNQQLSQIHREGRTIIMATHHAAHGISQATHLALLHRGRLVHFGVNSFAGDVQAFESFYFEATGARSTQVEVGT